MEHKENKNKWAIRGRTLWMYIRYQTITKLILILLFMPCFRLFTSFLIHSRGRTNISSGDYVQFFTGIYGIPVIVLGMLLLLVVLRLDINTFIIISRFIEYLDLQL